MRNEVNDEKSRFPISGPTQFFALHDIFAGGCIMRLQEAIGKNFWLSEDELHVELSNLDGWELDGEYIKKKYQFEDWKKITKFLEIITALVKKENHHPQFKHDSKNKWAIVMLRSHNQNALTKYDTEFAKKLDKKVK